MTAPQYKLAPAQLSWELNRHSAQDATHWPRVRETAASAGVWLRATETEISAALWALVAQEGL